MRICRAAARCIGIILVVAGVLTSQSTSVVAATATATLTVTATVASECSATGGTLAFGAYSPLSASNLDQSTTFTVTCTKGTTSTVGLDLGANASASTRRMINGAELLTYELYSDSGRTTVWGNSGGALVSLSAAPSNAPRTQTVYGRVPGSQNVGTGSYSDSVTITVTF